MKLSIIVPIFNEGPTISCNINAINEFAKGLYHEYEIIAVNDGSTDSSLELLEKASRSITSLKVVSYASRMGKGHAVKAGFLESKGDIVCFMDADLAVDLKYLITFIDSIKKGSDLVIASRLMRGSKCLNPESLSRRTITRLCVLLRKAIIGVREVEDTQCGFKVLEGKLARDICVASRTNGFCFDAELIYLTKKWNLKIVEWPVVVNNPRRDHIRIVRDSLDTFLDLLRVRTNDLLRKYER